MTKAPLAPESVGRNPSDRGKNGCKRSVLAGEKGLPLSIVISGANTHDVKLLAATLDDEIIDHPTEDSTQPNKTCALMPVVSAKRLSARLKKGVVSHTHQAKRNFFELNPPGLGRVLN
jgi:hypothetical protein